MSDLMVREAVLEALNHFHAEYWTNPWFWVVVWLLIAWWVSTEYQARQYRAAVSDAERAWHVIRFNFDKFING
jgi:hypothetical protein